MHGREDGYDSSVQERVVPRFRNSHGNGGKRSSELNMEQRMTQDSQVKKRKRTRDEKNKRRDRKRAADVTTITSIPNQRPLQVIVGEGLLPISSDSAVPWEHRCILGQTRG